MNYKPRKKITPDNLEEVLNSKDTPKSTLYSRKHFEHVREINRLYYLKNREKIIQATTENNRLNKDRHYEYEKRYKLNKKINKNHLH